MRLGVLVVASVCLVAQAGVATQPVPQTDILGLLGPMPERAVAQPAGRNGDRDRRADDASAEGEDADAEEDGDADDGEGEEAEGATWYDEDDILDSLMLSPRGDRGVALRDILTPRGSSSANDASAAQEMFERMRPLASPAVSDLADSYYDMSTRTPPPLPRRRPRDSSED